MMSKGRGSAVMAAAAAVCLLMLLTSEVAQAATYRVGGIGGWTFYTVGWPKGKRFKAGDILSFDYPKGAHNVVVVNKAGYDSCQAPSNARVYSSGRDQIKLVKGNNFFICTYEGHCAAAMKIAVTAT